MALTARRLGSEEVTMACLEKPDEMPAWDYEIDEATEQGVKIVNSLGPVRFYGKKRPGRPGGFPGMHSRV